ncbi:hypothetical protein BDY19DRAFT_992388 [Irpex rosettiformis]|uniref:Uncharacterized protein n=1 Tax=Irpex rosettiformis TaxID=378272 RepID=A0ACB8U7R5_9APHY|nr:hypothetical protein BDY19DRAFT_992388 [Irpex rosettiformis]
MSAVAGDEHHLVNGAAQENGAAHHEHAPESALESNNVAQPITEEEIIHVSKPFTQEELSEHAPTATNDDVSKEEVTDATTDDSDTTKDVSGHTVDEVIKDKELLEEEEASKGAYQASKESVSHVEGPADATVLLHSEAAPAGEVEESIPAVESTEELTIEELQVSTSEPPASAEVAATAQEAAREEAQEAEEFAAGPSVTAPATEVVSENIGVPEETHVSEPKQLILEAPSAVSEEVHTAQAPVVVEESPLAAENPVAEPAEETGSTVQDDDIPDHAESSGLAVETEAAVEPKTSATETTPIKDVPETETLLKANPVAEEGESEEEEAEPVAQAVSEKELVEDALEVGTKGEVKHVEADFTPESVAVIVEPSEEVSSAAVEEAELPEDSAVSQTLSEAEPIQAELAIELSVPESTAAMETEDPAEPAHEATIAPENVEQLSNDDETVAEECTLTDEVIEAAKLPDATPNATITEYENVETEAEATYVKESTLLNRDVETCDSSDKLIILSTSDQACRAEPDPALEARTSVPVIDEVAPTVVVHDTPIAEPPVEEKVSEDIIPETDEPKVEKTISAVPESDPAIVEDTRDASEALLAETTQTEEAEPTVVAVAPVKETPLSEVAETVTPEAPGLEESVSTVAETAVVSEESELKGEDIEGITAESEAADEEEHEAAAGLVAEEAAVSAAIPAAEPVEAAAEIVVPVESVAVEGASASEALVDEAPSTLAEDSKEEDLKPEASEQPERPKSPYVASYSVQTQGPGTATEEEVEELADAPTEEPVIVVSEETVAAAVEPTEGVEHVEATKSWPASWAVSSQGSSPQHAPQQTEDTDVEPIEGVSEEASLAPVVEAIVVSPIEEPKAIEETTVTEAEPVVAEHSEIKVSTSEKLLTPQIVAIDEDSKLVSPVIIPGDDEEEVPPIQETHPEPQVPERPWTPSYAVDQQGFSPMASDVHPEAVETGSTSLLDEVESIPAGVPEEPTSGNAEPEVASPAPVRPSSRSSWTPSYSVSHQDSGLSHEESEAPVDVQSGETLSKQESEIVAPTPQRPLSRSSFPAAYSVSRQGSRSSLKPEDTTESPPPVQAQSPVTTATLALVEEPVSEEPEAIKAPERPWTPSYAVDHQGSSPSPAAKELPSVESGSEKPAEEVQKASERPWTPSYNVSRQGTSPVHSPRVESTELTEPQLAPPERPWTPSYTVSRQGSSPALGNAELAPAVQDFPPVAVTDSTEFVEEKPATPMINVEEAAPAEPKAEEPGTQAEVNAATEAAKSVPERPWTPSYAVTTQGPGSPAHLLTEEAVHEAFPTTEVHDSGPKVSTKPSLARLAPLAEDRPTNVVSPAQIEETTVSPSKRTRHESNQSSTSSRYFPGGWFSGNPKSPDDNRTSLDHAAGEFSSQNGKGPDAPVNNTPTEAVAPAEKKKHYRSCVIF